MIVGLGLGFAVVELEGPILELGLFEFEFEIEP